MCGEGGAARGGGSSGAVSGREDGGRKQEVKDGELQFGASSIHAVRLTRYGCAFVGVHVKLAAQPLAATNARGLQLRHPPRGLVRRTLALDHARLILLIRWGSRP
jgi:hypothetical protein